jgi:hypothetical protein
MEQEVERQLARELSGILSQWRSVCASRHDIYLASEQFGMCASERFHQRFSSIDYDARWGFRGGEFRGKISETLTAPTLRYQRSREKSRSINRWSYLSFAKKPRNEVEFRDTLG